jgi:hypothetical protein
MVTITSGRHQYNQGKTVGMFNWRKYDVGAKKNFIFFHGSGEFGLIDGSQISKVQAHGYPKLLASKRAPVDFPVNVIAVQGVIAPKSKPPTTEWKAVKAGLYSFLDAMEIERLPVGGLSQGSLAALQYLWRSQDPAGRISGIVNICGKPPSGPSYPKDHAELRAIPIITVHGTKDLSGNGFNSMKNFLDWVSKGECAIPNPLHPSRFLPIPNGDHDDAWLKAYNPEDVTYGKPVLDFIVANQ